MKPRFRNYRLLVKFFVDDIGSAGFFPVFKMLGIGLFYHAKTSELSFGMIVITVMVFIRIYESPTRYFINRFGFRNTMNREMQLCDPWRTRFFILDIEF